MNSKSPEVTLRQGWMQMFHAFAHEMEKELKKASGDQDPSETVAHRIVASFPWIQGHDMSPEDNSDVEYIAGYLRRLFPHFFQNSTARLHSNPAHPPAQEDLQARSEECGYGAG